MPSNKIHCALSKKRTGFNFKELHQWIDKDEKKLGIDHRLNRHAFNKEESNIIKKYWEKKKGKGWGEKAVVEWLFHIAIDNLETAFKEANKAYRKNHVYNYFKFGLIPDSKYIFWHFGRFSEEKLEKEFNEDI